MILYFSLQLFRKEGLGIGSCTKENLIHMRVITEEGSLQVLENGGHKVNPIVQVLDVVKDIPV